MTKFGCPPRYITMVRQLHDDMHVLVQNDGELSQPYPVTIGVKQDCSLAAILFSTFSDMLMCVFYKDALCYLVPRQNSVQGN